MRGFSAAFTVGLVGLLSTSVLAQGSTSISAGPSLLFGPTSSWAGHGYHFQVSREFGHLKFLTFRADALYSQNPGTGLAKTERTFAFAGSALLRGGSVGPLKPYALAGIGMYGIDSWSSYTPGINAGLGIETSVKKVTFFSEWRVHQFWRDARNSPIAGRGVTLAPISLGIRF